MIFARVSSTTHLLLFRLLFRRVVGSDGSGGNLSQFGFDVGAGTSRFGSGSGAATVLVGFDERVATAKRVGIVVVGRNGRLIMQDETTALAGRAFLGERLDQTLADALAGHLHQTERGDFGHLMCGRVPSIRPSGAAPDRGWRA